MSSQYDIIVVGSGHNGLTTAAYLAKAGLKVVVLERNDYAGGGVVTHEMTVPGFHHDRHSSLHMVIQANPLIANDELGLISKYGLKYHTAEYPDAMFGTSFDDGRVLLMYKDIDKSAEYIAQYSEKDAHAYREFATMATGVLPILAQGFATPPAPMGAMVALLDQSVEGRELLRMMMISAKQVIEEWFENDYVKIHLLALISEALQLPDENCTGIAVLLFVAMCHKYGLSRPVGGSGKLSEALIACIEDNGGEILLNQDVSKFIFNGNQVTGVETRTGERYLARKSVVGSIHPHLLRNYFPDVDAGVLKRAERVNLSPFSVFLLHGALNEPMKWRCGDDIKRAFFIEAVSTDLIQFYKDFDSLKYPGLPTRFSRMALMAQDVHDPIRSPEGKGLIYAATYANYKWCTPEGWDRVKEEYGELMLKELGRWISNATPDNIIAKRFEFPADMERDSLSFIGGDTHGCGTYFWQMGGYRPTPDLAQYRVPGIDGFYLVGPFMHPAGGVTGGGRGTAMRMMGDMKIDFTRAIGA